MQHSLLTANFFNNCNNNNDEILDDDCSPLKRGVLEMCLTDFNKIVWMCSIHSHLYSSKAVRCET